MNIPREFSQPVFIGRGSFSTVCRVYEKKLERHVVLKIISAAHTAELVGIEKEAYVLASLRLPCVPHIYNVLHLRKKAIIVMEWIRGIPLSLLLTEELNTDTKKLIAVNIIHALTLLHQSNIAHRDLKPENIIVTSNGDIVFVDFGFSLPQPAAKSTSNAMRGTPTYMAPELWTCEETIDYKKADLYSLGMVLQQLFDKEFPELCISLIAADPMTRPPDCASFEQRWREHFLPDNAAGVLHKNMQGFVEEFTARLLMQGAKELFKENKKEESYALVTESLEAWPDYNEALNYLQDNFSSPIDKLRRGKKVFYWSLAAVLIIGMIASAYLIGLRSSASTAFLSEFSFVEDMDDRQFNRLSISKRDMSSQTASLTLREISSGNDVDGEIVIVPPTTPGAFFIDGTQIKRKDNGRLVVTLSSGTHRIEWFDSTSQLKYGETIDLLPFETKTVSLYRFFNEK